MFKNFGLCLVLEDNIDYDDTIDGVFQIYEKTALMQENQISKSYSETNYEFMTMKNLMESKYASLNDR
jgi:hypothetical protein